MMTVIQRVLRYHWPALVLALFIGVSVLLPHILLQQQSQYRGIELMGQDAEEHYIARVNEIYKGDYVLGNTFLPDKDKPYLQPPVGEIIQAWIGKALFLDAPRGIVAAKFIFPFLCALALYWLCFILSRSRIAAILGTAAAIAGFQLMSGVGPWIELLQGVLHAGSYSIFARPINPQISSLVMFVALALIYQAFFMRERVKKWEIVLIGVLTGISCYMSPYTFTFLGLILLLLTIYFLLVRNFPRMWGGFAAGVIGLVSTVPFAINYFFLHADPGFTELAMRQGLVSDRTPILSIWLVFMLGAVLFAWPKVYKKSRAFFIILVASLWILTDQNFFTGVTLHPSHYHWYITKPLLSLMVGMYAAYALALLFKEQKYIRITLAAAAMFVLCYTSPLLHIPWNLAHPDQTALAAQQYAPALAMLNNLPEAQVVWADPILSQYVSIYTKHDAPNNPYAIYYLNPPSFYESALFLKYRLQGETPDSILATLKKDRVDVSGWLYGLYYRQAYGDLAAIPDETLSMLAGKYAQFYTRSYRDIFTELKLTAVVTPEADVQTYDRIDALHLFESSEGYRVYTVK